MSRGNVPMPLPVTANSRNVRGDSRTIIVMKIELGLILVAEMAQANVWHVGFRLRGGDQA